MIQEQQRLYNIQYVELTYKSDKNRIYWNGLCHICADSSDISEWSLKKHDFICKKCKYLKKRSAYHKDKNIHSPDKALDKRTDLRVSNRLATLKYRDKHLYFKNPEQICDFTLEEFTEILKKPCNYCESLKVSGVDRLDNNKGHIKINCVPCCYECNIARGRNFSPDEMKLIGKVIKEIKLARKNKV